MPNRVFNVLRVDGLVHLKLFDPTLILTGVVERNAALPMPRRVVGIKAQFTVEIGDRRLHPPFAKMAFAARVEDCRCVAPRQGRVGVVFGIALEDGLQLLQRGVVIFGVKGGFRGFEALFVVVSVFGVVFHG